MRGQPRAERRTRAGGTRAAAPPVDPRLRDAQSRVVHLVSLQQLETILVDADSGTTDRHALLCFTTPRTERADDDLLFPFLSLG